MQFKINEFGDLELVELAGIFTDEKSKTDVSTVKKSIDTVQQRAKEDESNAKKEANTLSGTFY